MQLVIKVDLDKAKLSLPEIFKLVGDCRWRHEVREEPLLGAEGPIHDEQSRAIGEWEIEDVEKDRPHPLETPYRAAAIAKYSRPGQIEIDRFASVSAAESGAYVQGWLFIPQTEIGSGASEAAPSRKPPQSAASTPDADRKVG
jgi:hypothetical protein